MGIWFDQSNIQSNTISNIVIIWPICVNTLNVDLLLCVMFSLIQQCTTTRKYSEHACRIPQLTSNIKYDKTEKNCDRRNAENGNNCICPYWKS